jgi:hypothetical protein
MVSLLVVGPALLTLVSWLHMYLVGSAPHRRRLAGWTIAGVVLAPAAATYAWATGQWPYVVANAVFGVLAARALRREARSGAGRTSPTDG